MKILNKEQLLLQNRLNSELSAICSWEPFGKMTVRKMQRILFINKLNRSNIQLLLALNHLKLYNTKSICNKEFISCVKIFSDQVYSKMKRTTSSSNVKLDISSAMTMLNINCFLVHCSIDCKSSSFSLLFTNKLIFKTMSILWFKSKYYGYNSN